MNATASSNGYGAAFGAGPSNWEWAYSQSTPLLVLEADPAAPGFYVSAYPNTGPVNPTAQPVSVGNFIGAGGEQDSSGNTVGNDFVNGTSVSFGGSSQQQYDSYYFGLQLYSSVSGYNAVYYGWLEFQAGPPYSCNSESTLSCGGVIQTGNWPQMFLVAGAISMAPGAIQVGSYYGNPTGSPNGPYNGSASPYYPSTPSPPS